MRKLRLREVISTYHWLTCSCFILFLKTVLFLFVFKVFIEFATILFLFYVLVFWSLGRWDLSSPTRDLTHTPCVGRRSPKHWTTREVLFIFLSPSRGLPRWLSGKESACHCRKCETWVRSLGQEDPLGEEMATHSSILAWKILRTEEPGGLCSIGLQRVGVIENPHALTPSRR